MRFWRQEQSPECGGLVAHHRLRVSLQSSLLHCLKAFHSSEENKPSTIFPVCRRLPFKKHPSLPSIRHASCASPLSRYLLVSASEQPSAVGSFQCVGEDRPPGSISASCGCWKTRGEAETGDVNDPGKDPSALLPTARPLSPACSRAAPPARPGPALSPVLASRFHHVSHPAPDPESRPLPL